MQVAQAMACFVAGRYEEAISTAQIATPQRPNFSLPNCIAAASAALSGRIEDAHKVMARVREIAPSLSQSNAGCIMAFRRREDRNRWAEGLRKAGLPE